MKKNGNYIEVIDWVVSAFTSIITWALLANWAWGWRAIATVIATIIVLFIVDEILVSRYNKRIREEELDAVSPLARDV